MHEFATRYLTPLHLIPSYIVGRDEELQSIHAALQSETPLLLINGTAGQGKTTIAMEYVRRYSKCYSHIAWITVNESLCNSFFGNRGLLETLKLSKKVRKMLISEQIFQAFEILLNKISAFERPLLVIDNANNYADLGLYQRLLYNPKLVILITSRASPTGWPIIQLRHLQPNYAAALFRHHYSSISIPDELLDGLLKRFAYLTLLVELMAKSASRSGMSLAKIQSMSTSEDNQDDLFGNQVDTGLHGVFNDENMKRATIKRYMKLLFKDVSDLSESETNILRVFCLAPPAMPLSRAMVTESFAILKLRYDPDAIFKLIEKGWLLQERTEGNNYLFTIHPAVKEFVTDEMKVTIQFAEPLIKHAYGILADKITFNGYRVIYKFEAKRQWQEFIDHIRTIYFKPDLNGT